MANGNKPSKVIRLGLVSAAVFNNVQEAAGNEEERVMRSVQMQRRYRDADGNWKTSTSFDLAHLPAAIEALRLAFQYLVEQEADGGRGTS